VPIVGLNYYDPLLALIWFTTFDLDALEAEAKSDVLNGTLEGIYSSFGDPVAKVDEAFANTDLPSSRTGSRSTSNGSASGHGSAPPGTTTPTRTGTP
jgi:hypothetical protein